MRRVNNTLLLSYACIISSAAFYAASFLIDFCWWISFICFVPLFIQRFSSYTHALRAGFLWGLVAYGLTLSALLEVIIRLGEKPLSYLYALGFLGYFVFFSMGWCLSALFFKRCTNSWAGGWFVSTVLYCAWMHTGFFYFLTGYCYGYPLANPLLPLMNVAACLGLLPHMGWYGLLAALVCVQVGIAQKKKGMFFLGSMPFIAGFFVFHHPERSAEQDQKVVMVSQVFYEKTPYERAQELCDALCKVQRVHPSAQLFVLPESAFPFPLNEYPCVQEMLTQACKGSYLVLGSHYACVSRTGEESLYNSAYVLHAGRIMHRYDKKLLLPFFEEHPTQSFFLQRTASPFFDGKCAFTASEKNQELCTLPGVGTFSFCICSELLWDIPRDSQVLVLVNDGHYAFSYFSRLFRLFAHFQALEKRSTLLYCGWKH